MISKNLHSADVRTLVFRTSLFDEIDLWRAEIVLNNHALVQRWTVDLEDWEKVLKVEAFAGCTYEDISRKIRGLGYECEELDH